MVIPSDFFCRKGLGQRRFSFHLGFVLVLYIYLLQNKNKWKVSDVMSWCWYDRIVTLQFQMLKGGGLKGGLRQIT